MLLEFQKYIIDEYQINDTISDFNPSITNHKFKWYYSNNINNFNSNYPVYKLLYIYEELFNYIFENSNPQPLFKWLLESYKLLSDQHKKLFNLAFFEEIDYYGSPPYYHRPSILLLDSEWMNNHNYKNVKNGVKSYCFYESGNDIINTYCIKTN